jgi:tetratricopeptide (TPR) repeat protein
MIRCAPLRSLMTFLALAVAGCASLAESKLLTGPSVAQQRQKRSADAIKDFDQARSAAEFKSAVTCYEQGDLAGCQQALERLLQRDPHHREARLLMAEMLLVKEDPQGAGKHAEEVLKADPKDQHAQQIVRLASQARAVGAAGDDSADDDDGAEVQPLLSKAEASLGKGATQEAVAALRQAIAAQPRDPQIPVAAAVILLRSNQPDPAADLLSEASRAFPDCAAVHRTLGVARYRQGDYKSSQTALQQALSLDKSSALSYFLMGCTLAKLGQSEAAQTHFRQAQQIDPKYAVPR